jgi:hypothetical protein
MVESARTQMAIQHMHFARWMNEATDTHSEYVILLFYSNNGNVISPPHYIGAMDSTVKPHINLKVMKLINKLLMPLLYLRNFCPALIITSSVSSLTGEAW